MVNDGNSKDYDDGRTLYADPMRYLDRLKGRERADAIYAPDKEEAVAKEREAKNIN